MKFKTGEEIRQSGIYLVSHKEHRLPHEVTLIQDEVFPTCSKCKTAVYFELLRAVSPDWGKIVLYELPALHTDEDLGEDEEAAS